MRHIVTGRHEVTMTYVAQLALMVNNAFFQEGESFRAKKKWQTCQPNLTAVYNM